MPPLQPPPRIARPGRLALAALIAGSGYGWWHWKRIQPEIDAETARRLRARDAA